MKDEMADSTLIQSYIDGELEGSDLEEFERKLGESEELRELVCARETEHDNLCALLAAPPAPDLLRARIKRGLDGVDAERSVEKRKELFGWLLPGSATAVAAAALAFFVTNSSVNEAPERSPHVARDAVEQRFRPQPVALVAAKQAEPVQNRRRGFNVALKESSPVLRAHMQVSQALSEYFQRRVVAPYFSDPAVQLSGWRPSQIRGRAAAELHYSVDGSAGDYQVVIHILSANDLDLRGRSLRRSGTKRVWLDQAHGYNAVLYKDAFGVGYVFSSEMPEDDLVDLVMNSDLLRQQ